MIHKSTNFFAFYVTKYFLCHSKSQKKMLRRIQMERKCTCEVKRWLYCVVIVNCILLCSLLNYYCCLLLEVNKNQLLQLTYNLIKHKWEKEISKNSISSFCLFRSLKILLFFIILTLFLFVLKFLGYCCCYCFFF